MVLEQHPLLVIRPGKQLFLSLALPCIRLYVLAPDSALHQPGKVIKVLEGVYLTMSCRDGFDLHRLENVSACLRVVKAIAAGVKLNAVIFEVALVLREIQVPDEMGCFEDSLAVLFNVDSLIR